MQREPAYARFFKCDLHMHSPFDRDWRDEATRLKHDDPLDRKKNIAREYLKACYEAELEVIAITDHNFAPDADKSFIKLLHEENKAVAREMKKKELVIFPGFEIQAHVGKGCHVICLFPPDTKLTEVDDKLTELGLPRAQRFDGDVPRPCPESVTLRTIIEKVQLNYKGIVIIAHSLSDKGIWDNDRIQEWLQQEEFRNPDLLCVEIPRPLEELKEGFRKILSGGPDCLPEWRRHRPVAYIMSSDCRILRAGDCKGPNWIGSKYSWIKMTEPSLEALRQAFLDHDSRIRLSKGSPDAQYTYPKITRVAVRGGKFLRDTGDLYFSPNLNCIIGSRGTGKSMLFDYMRKILNRLSSEDLPESTAAEIDRKIKDTLPPEATVEVDLETKGGRYQVIIQGDKHEILPYEQTVSDEIIDIRTLFPCRILSQGQINHIIEQKDQKALRRFLDDFIIEELDALQREKKILLDKLKELEVKLESRKSKQQDRPIIETKLRELRGQMESQKSLLDVLPQWQKIERERTFFERIFEKCKHIVTQWREYVKDLQPDDFIETSSEVLSVDIIIEAKREFKLAIERLRKKIEDAINEFEKETYTDKAKIRAIYEKSGARSTYK